MQKKFLPIISRIDSKMYCTFYQLLWTQIFGINSFYWHQIVSLLQFLGGFMAQSVSMLTHFSDPEGKAWGVLIRLCGIVNVAGLLDQCAVCCRQCLYQCHCQQGHRFLFSMEFMHIQVIIIKIMFTLIFFFGCSVFQLPKTVKTILHTPQLSKSSKIFVAEVVEKTEKLQ